VQRFRQAPFPLYGLPASWLGLRYLEGSMTAWSRGRPEAVVEASLGHGDPIVGEGPWLRVAVTSVDAEAARTLTTIRDRLANDLRRAGTHPAGAAGTEPPGAPDWSPVTLTVGGRSTVFEWLAAGRHWVAVAEVGSEVVCLQSRDLPVADVELVRITDLEPYLAGQSQLRRPDR